MRQRIIGRLEICYFWQKKYITADMHSHMLMEHTFSDQAGNKET